MAQRHIATLAQPTTEQSGRVVVVRLWCSCNGQAATVARMPRTGFNGGQVQNALGPAPSRSNFLWATRRVVQGLAGPTRAVLRAADRVFIVAAWTEAFQRHRPVLGSSPASRAAWLLTQINTH